MATISYSRQASPDEMAAEIDRRGRAIEELEAKVATTIDELMAANRRAADDAEHFIQTAVDDAPEPLRRLGEWLANKLDEDDWKTADRLLNGAAIELSTLKRQLAARGGVSEGAVEAGLAGGVKAFDSASDDTTMEDFRRQFVKAILEAAAPLMCGAGWKTIDSAPCDDTEALVFWRDGRMTIEDLDHDSSPEWWAKRGATHWRHKPAAPAPTAHKTERPS